MDWKEWIMKSTAANWMQISVSIIALLVSVGALITSRRTHNATVKTILDVKSVGFRNDYSVLFVKLHNSGPGRAYDVKVSAYKKTAYNDTRYFFIKGLWVESHKTTADGESLVSFIQPDAEETFIFKSMDIYGFHHRRPIMVKYKLGNEKSRSSYWLYHLGSTRVSKMNTFTMLYYRFFGKYLIDKIDESAKKNSI